MEQYVLGGSVMLSIIAVIISIQAFKRSKKWTLKEVVKDLNSMQLTRRD